MRLIRSVGPFGLALFALVFVTGAAATTKNATAPVRVFVSRSMPDSATVIYRYTVKNGSPHGMARLIVGWDFEQGRFDLFVGPRGWEGDSIPAPSYRAPHGWTCDVITAEEDSVITIAWDSIDPKNYVPARRTAGGFEITLDRADPGYETGHWGVMTAGGNYAGRLEPVAVQDIPGQGSKTKSGQPQK